MWALVGFNGTVFPALWKCSVSGARSLAGQDVPGRGQPGPPAQLGPSKPAQERRPDPGAGRHWTGQEGFGTCNPAHKGLLYRPWKQQSWISHIHRWKYPLLSTLIWECSGVQLKCTAYFTMKTLRKGTGKKINTQMIWFREGLNSLLTVVPLWSWSESCPLLLRWFLSGFAVLSF